MEALMILLVGGMVFVGVYLLLRRNLIRVMFGVMILSNAVNLLIFTMGRFESTVPPVIPYGLDAPAEVIANPLPQALILTAIVIGFGLIVFAMVLLMRMYDRLKTLEADEIETAEPEDPEFNKDIMEVSI